MVFICLCVWVFDCMCTQRTKVIVLIYCVWCEQRFWLFRSRSPPLTFARVLFCRSFAFYLSFVSSCTLTWSFQIRSHTHTYTRHTRIHGHHLNFGNFSSIQRAADFFKSKFQRLLLPITHELIVANKTRHFRICIHLLSVVWIWFFPLFQFGCFCFATKLQFTTNKSKQVSC